MMDKNKKKIYNRFRVPLIITCPICGFTFRFIDPMTGRKNQKCPICSNHIKEYSKSRLEKFYIDII